MRERLILLGAAVLTVGALAIGGAKEVKAAPPFGDLPVPPAGGGKPVFVGGTICDFVENTVSAATSGKGAPNCQ